MRWLRRNRDQIAGAVRDFDRDLLAVRGDVRAALADRLVSMVNGVNTASAGMLARDTAPGAAVVDEAALIAKLKAVIVDGE